MTKTINILASDFENNWYTNCKEDGTGCPILRGLFRAGIDVKIFPYSSVTDEDSKVFEMFKGELPVEDFSFKVEVSEHQLLK